MPITEAERRKLKTHTFSEDRKGEFGWTHSIAPELKMGETLGNALGMMFSDPYPLAINLSGSLIFTAYIFGIFTSGSLFYSLAYTLIFFFAGIVIIAPLSAFSKARFAGIKPNNTARPMLISLVYLSPLVPILYVGVLVLTFHELFASQILNILAPLFILSVAVILHMINLSVSLATDSMYDGGLDRSTALGRSWMMISGQSLRMLLIDVVAFLPLILGVLIEALFRSNAAIALYMLPIIFIATEFSTSWWHACVSYAYTTISKKVKPMQYSRL